MPEITLVAVKMQDGSTKLKLSAPYHPSLPARARGLGGKFNSTTKAWYFDPRDEARIRDLCREIYGTDGSTPPALQDLVTLRVILQEYDYATKTGFSDDVSLWLAGREVCRRPYRDAAVKLGDGVVVIAGGFPSSGGSAKNPRLAWRSGTVLEVRNVPRALAEAEAAKHPGLITIEAPTAPAGEADRQAKIAALLARREELQKELDFVNAQLSLLLEIEGEGRL